MPDEPVAELLRATEGFLTPLRVGDGFNERSFMELCRVLEDLARQWRMLDSIPKPAVNVLIDLWPGIQSCSYLYKGEEANQIMKAADTVADLTRDIVMVEDAFGR
jgi:hypothetical protein